MPRITPADELQLIESIVAAHPDGIGIAEIELAMAQRQGGALNRRTLQRRLLKLMDAQRIVSEGQSIALVYKPVAQAWAQLARGGVSAPLRMGVGVAEAEPDLPVTPAGASIRDRVRQPLMHRRPVGYRREFLEAYQPGVTFYLPAALRSQLHEMGRTPAHEPVSYTHLTLPTICSV